MSTPKARLTRRDTIQARARALAGSPPANAQAVTETPDSGESPEVAMPTAELWLYGVVGGWWWGFDAETVAEALRQIPEDVTDIRVRLHSPGGNAVDGIAIGNLLRNHPATVTVVVDGLAASAASVIALAGDDIVMSPGAQVMIHDASVLTYGNAAQLRSDAEWIDKQSKNYAELYASRGGTAEGWREAMTADAGRGTWYTAQESVEAGLADRVGTVQSTTPPPPEPAPEGATDDESVAARVAWDRDVLVHPDAWAAWSTTPGALPRPPNPPSASAVGSPPPKEGGSVVALSDQAVTTLRNGLGIAEDADEGTIMAAFAEVLAEQADPDPQVNQPTVPEGTVLVEATVFEDMRVQAREGAEARQQQRIEHRDRVIDAAITEGRFAPARREHYQASWDADPEGTEQIIASLAPGLVPVSEIGHDQSTATGNHADVDPSELNAFAAQLGLTEEDLRG